jgi:deoxyribodipyrimidine photo-lyase
VPRGIEVEQQPIPTCESLGITVNPAVLAGAERAAEERLRRFLRQAAPDYAQHRGRMDLAGTSRLSVDLKFGTISARRVWTAVEETVPGSGAARSFLNELVWREFTHSTLWDRPSFYKSHFERHSLGSHGRKRTPVEQRGSPARPAIPCMDGVARFGQ